MKTLGAKTALLFEINITKIIMISTRFESSVFVADFLVEFPVQRTVEQLNWSTLIWQKEKALSFLIMNQTKAQPMR